MLFRLGFGVCLSLVASGCGSDDDVHQAGKPTSGQCPIGIASTQDANNNVNVLNNGLMIGSYSGSDSDGVFTADCVHLNFGEGQHHQLLKVVLRGKKPVAGDSYDIGTDEKSPAVIRYAEDNDGSHVWIGSAGAVKITTAAKGTVGFALDSVQLVPDKTKSDNTATGELTATGSATTSDLPGF